MPLPPGGARENLAGACHVAEKRGRRRRATALRWATTWRSCKQGGAGRAVGVAWSFSTRRMLPWLGPWGTGQAEATEGLGLSTGGDHGEAWRPGEEMMEKQDAPVQDR